MFGGEQRANDAEKRANDAEKRASTEFDARRRIWSVCGRIHNLYEAHVYQQLSEQLAWPEWGIDLPKVFVKCKLINLIETRNIAKSATPLVTFCQSTELVGWWGYYQWWLGGEVTTNDGWVVRLPPVMRRSWSPVVNSSWSLLIQTGSGAWVNFCIKQKQEPEQSTVLFVAFKSSRPCYPAAQTHTQHYVNAQKQLIRSWSQH